MVEIPSNPSNETPPSTAIYPVFVPGAQPGDPGRVISKDLAGYSELIRSGASELVATAFVYDEETGVLTITLSGGDATATQDITLGITLGDSVIRSIATPSAGVLRFTKADGSDVDVDLSGAAPQTDASIGGTGAADAPLTIVKRETLNIAESEAVIAVSQSMTAAPTIFQKSPLPLPDASQSPGYAWIRLPKGVPATDVTVTLLDRLSADDHATFRLSDAEQFVYFAADPTPIYRGLNLLGSDVSGIVVNEPLAVDLLRAEVWLPVERLTGMITLDMLDPTVVARLNDAPEGA